MLWNLLKYKIKYPVLNLPLKYYCFIVIIKRYFNTKNIVLNKNFRTRNTFKSLNDIQLSEIYSNLFLKKNL